MECTTCIASYRARDVAVQPINNSCNQQKNSCTYVSGTNCVSDGANSKLLVKSDPGIPLSNLFPSILSSLTKISFVLPEPQASWSPQVCT